MTAPASAAESPMHDAAALLADDPAFRVLRRLEVPTGPTDRIAEKTWSAAVIDVEATGLDVATAEIVELAVRRIRFDPECVITEIGTPRTWLQQPSAGLSEEVALLTGLTDADLAGQALDEDEIVGILRGVDCIIAHNAGYDRRMVERRLPAAAGRAWACSCREIDWRRRGYDGRSLGYLLCQSGFFSNAHRAAADVDALISLLGDRRGSDRTTLAELIVTASEPGWLVTARGAAYETRGLLKARGYRWDPDGKAWSREIAASARADEAEWLEANVYSREARPKFIAPGWTETTWWTRHG